MITKIRSGHGNGRGWCWSNGKNGAIVLDGNKCAPNGVGVGEGIGHGVDEGGAEGYGCGVGLCTGCGEEWGAGEGSGNPQGRGEKWGHYDEDDEGSEW